MEWHDDDLPLLLCNGWFHPLLLRWDTPKPSVVSTFCKHFWLVFFCDLATNCCSLLLNLPPPFPTDNTQNSFSWMSQRLPSEWHDNAWVHSDSSKSSFLQWESLTYAIKKGRYHCLSWSGWSMQKYSNDDHEETHTTTVLYLDNLWWLFLF